MTRLHYKLDRREKAVMTTFLKKYFALRKRNTLIAWEKAKQFKFCYAFLAPYLSLIHI